MKALSMLPLFKRKLFSGCFRGVFLRCFRCAVQMFANSLGYSFAWEMFASWRSDLRDFLPFVSLWLAGCGQLIPRCSCYFVSFFGLILVWLRCLCFAFPITLA